MLLFCFLFVNVLVFCLVCRFILLLFLFTWMLTKAQFIVISSHSNKITNGTVRLLVAPTLLSGIAIVVQFKEKWNQSGRTHAHRESVCVRLRDRTYIHRHVFVRNGIVRRCGCFCVCVVCFICSVSLLVFGSSGAIALTICVHVRKQKKSHNSNSFAVFFCVCLSLISFVFFVNFRGLIAVFQKKREKNSIVDGIVHGENVVIVIHTARANMMKMEFHQRLFLCCLCILIFNGSGGVNARICGEIDVRNDPWYLEVSLRGCTIVTGSLSIVLIERNNATFDIRNVSFPELR